MVVTDRWSLSNKKLGGDISILTMGSGATAIEGWSKLDDVQIVTDALDTNKASRVTFFYKATKVVAPTNWKYKWQVSFDGGTTWCDVTKLDGTAIAQITLTATATEAYSIKAIAPLTRLAIEATDCDGVNYWTFDKARAEVIP